jgi:ferredoxin-NADP reductase
VIVARERRMADQERSFEIEVTGKVRLADGVVMLRVARPDHSLLPAWTPGAHIDVTVPGGLIRQYSLCNESGGDTRSWEIAVLREGPGSRYMHDTASTGEVLAAHGPRNHFPLLPSQRYIFIAGGIGITPFRPMLAEVSTGAAEWQLLYGGRSRSSMAFLDEFATNYGSQLDPWPLDERGLIDLRVLDQPSDGTLIYCCGPESLLQAVEERCSRWPAGSLRVERFRPKEQATTVRQHTFEVILARSGKTVRVRPESSILICVREAGLDVASSCEEGICGTCETRVLEGEVDHRDSILTAEERAANDTMMICCSRALSDRLVLDL